MSRISLFSSPLFLGFEPLERLLDQPPKGTEGYPPYNIERFEAVGDKPETWCITLALAGFAARDLSVRVEGNQLVIKGCQAEETVARDYLHRGIAGRAFTRAFVLADGMDVSGARLQHALLIINLIRNQPRRRIIEIDVKD